MTSVATFRAALSTNALFGICMVLALMAYYQTTDLYELSYTTSVAWTSLLEDSRNWILTHFAIVKADVSQIVNAPSSMATQFQDNGHAVTQ